MVTFLIVWALVGKVTARSVRAGFLCVSKPPSWRLSFLLTRRFP
jgi:hypothetical protein